MDGASKFPIFLLPTVRACFARGVAPRLAATAIASWYVFLRRLEAGRLEFDYVDPKLPMVRPLLAPGREEEFARLPGLWGTPRAATRSSCARSAPGSPTSKRSIPGPDRNLPFTRTSRRRRRVRGPRHRAAASPALPWSGASCRSAVRRRLPAGRRRDPGWPSSARQGGDRRHAAPRAGSADLNHPLSEPHPVPTRQQIRYGAGSFRAWGKPRAAGDCRTEEVPALDTLGVPGSESGVSLIDAAS